MDTALDLMASVLAVKPGNGPHPGGTWNAVATAATASDFAPSTITDQVIMPDFIYLPCNVEIQGSLTVDGELVAGSAFAPTAVQTANYAASPGDFVVCSTAGGAFTITLPMAPPDKSNVGATLVTRAGSNAVTIAASGTDVFNTAGGATTLTLSLLNQGVLLQYDQPAGIWYEVAGDLSPSQLPGPPDWLNVVTQFGADPTGANDSAPAINAALQAAPAGSEVYVPPGFYKLNTPIVMPSTVALTGPRGTNVETFNLVGGAVLQPSSSFTNGGQPLAAAIYIPGTSTEPKIAHIMVDGHNAPASVHGIATQGNSFRVFLEYVLLSRCTGDGLHQEVDAGLNQPDSWHGTNVWARFCTGNGFALRSADSSWVDCEAYSNTGDGWNINSCGNSKWVGCRAEWNSGHGYHFWDIDAPGGVLFSACSTDHNQLNGFFVDGGSSTSSHVININGCNFRRDGQNNGSNNFSGISITGAYGAPVKITGTMVWAASAVGFTGQCPEWGLFLTGANQYVSVESSHLNGVTGPISNDGNTVFFHVGKTMSYATGALGAGLTYYAGGSYAIIKPSSTSRATNATPSADPALTTQLPPNSTWRFRFWLQYEGATAGQIQVGCTIPSGATLASGVDGLATGAAATTGSENRAAITAGSSYQTEGSAGGSTPTVMTYEGTVIVGSTAGTFALQWAQGTSSGTATVVMAGSCLSMEQIA